MRESNERRERKGYGMILEGMKDKTAEMIIKGKKGIQKRKIDRKKERETNLNGN